MVLSFNQGLDWEFWEPLELEEMNGRWGHGTHETKPHILDVLKLVLSNRTFYGNVNDVYLNCPIW